MSDGPGRGDTGDDAVPVGGGFDAAHLQAVHRHLFDGVDPTHNPPCGVPFPLAINVPPASASGLSATVRCRAGLIARRCGELPP